MAVLSELLRVYARKISASPVLFVGFLLSAISFAATLNMFGVLLKEIDDQKAFQLSLSSRTFIQENKPEYTTHPVASEALKNHSTATKPHVKDFGVPQGDRDELNAQSKSNYFDWSSIPRVGADSSKKGENVRSAASSSKENRTQTDIAALSMQLSTLSSQLASSQSIIARLVTQNSQFAANIYAANLRNDALNQELSNLSLRISSQQTFTNHVSVLTVCIMFSTSIFSALGSLVALFSYRRSARKDDIASIDALYSESDSK